MLSILKKVVKGTGRTWTLGAQGRPSGRHPPALHHPVLNNLAQAAAGLGEGAQQGEGSEGGGGGGHF